MNAFITDVRQTVAPPRGSKDGLLPPLLVALTAVTGLVDAFSYLMLGHVFVANMTGNVVFLAGATGARAARRLISVVAMLLGALVGALGILHVHIVFPLVIALLILVAVAGVVWSDDPKTPDTAA